MKGLLARAAAVASAAVAAAAAAAAAAGAAQAVLLLLAKPCRSRVSLPGLSLTWLLLWLLLLLCSLMGCSLMQLLCILLDLVQHGQVVSRRSAQRWDPGPQLLSDRVLMRGRGGKLQLPLHLPSWKASMGASAWVGLDQQWDQSTSDSRHSRDPRSRWPT